MEFFNYAYCSLLHKNNEIDNLNILINNVYKDIENKNTNIKNVFESHLQNIRLKKYKMLHFKHIIIKLIFEIHHTKQEIKKNTNIKTAININIAQNKLIKRTASGYVLQYKKIQKHNTMYNIFDSIIINKDSFDLNNINAKIIYFLQNLNTLQIYLENTILKKNKLILHFQYIDLLFFINKFVIESDINNLYFIEHTLYKILQYDITININNNIKSFIKYKKSIVESDKKLERYINKTNKKILSDIEYEKKLHNRLNSKIQVYNRIYKSIQIKKKQVKNVVISHEKNIQKLSKILDELNNKYKKLEYYLENVHKIDCPEEIKKKCTVVSEDDNTTCCICINPILMGAKTICGHLYHVHCLNLYIYSIINNDLDNIKIQCPLCRKFI